MSDWPSGLISPHRSIIHPQSPGQPTFTRAGTGSPAAAAWPAANRAIYSPILIEVPTLVTQMFIYIGAQAGNVDVGLYGPDKARLVSIGSTVVGAAGLQLLNITDTTLTPGNYWMGMVCSTVTTLTLQKWGPNNLLLQTMGVQQEALGATTLPNPATFANPANSYLPVFGCLTELAA